MSTVLTDKDAKSNLAANLRRLLDSRGWSLRELARQTGEAPITISRAMRGQNIPDVVALARIAEALDISIDRLVAAPPEKSAQPA